MGLYAEGYRGAARHQSARQASCPAVGNISGGFKLSSGKQRGTESKREKGGVCVRVYVHLIV